MNAPATVNDAICIGPGGLAIKSSSAAFSSQKLRSISVGLRFAPLPAPQRAPSSVRKVVAIMAEAAERCRSYRTAPARSEQWEASSEARLMRTTAALRHVHLQD